ncbi:MAG: PD-(D/E)XK nuclease family protein, partial [Bacilli bacterium]|nr:PD-(D/E)XK nuclease family protein [Bacilli bacterium]
MDLSNVIIVADRDYFPLVFSLKNKHPEYSWKIITKDELLDRVSFSFGSDPIPLLIREGISYNDAKKYLSIFRAANFEKDEKLKAVYDSIKDCAVVDELGLYEIKSKPLMLLEMNEDFEVHELLKRKGIDFSDVSLADLGAERKTVPDVLSFPDRFTQYNYIYSDIRSKLLKDPSLASRILVLINDTSDIYYVRQMSSLYGVNSYATYGVPFLSDPKTKKKVNDIFASKSFAFTEEERLDEGLKPLFDIVLKYKLAEVPFEFGYSNLIEITNALVMSERIDESGVTIENRFTLNPNDIIYVTCFQYGVFYKEFDDKNVLSDAELVNIGANPSYAKTNLDRRKKKNYIFYNETPVLSRVRQHLSDKIYDSQFLEELDVNLKEREEEGFKPKELWANKTKKTSFDHKEAIYTSKAAELYKADQYDKKFYYGSKGEYRSYNHKFKGIFSDTAYNPSHWSVTNLEHYIECPYKYYMQRVLPDLTSDKHAMWLGNLGHHLVERIFRDDYDFDIEWDIGVEQYKRDLMDEGLVFNEREKAYLEILKDWMRLSVRYIRRKRNEMSLCKELYETPICFSINDDEENSYVFKGKIDKILITGSAGSKWLTVIDYKTGAEVFEAKQAMTCFLGASIQVPLYVYALSHQIDDPEYKEGDKRRTKKIEGIEDCRIGGCGIEPILFKARPFFEDKGKLSGANLAKNVKLGGIKSNSESYTNSVDLIHPNDKGKPIPQETDLLGQKLSFTEPDADENILKKQAENMPKYNLNDMIEDAKNGAIRTIEDILANKFPIEPTSSDLKGNKSQLVCSRCAYRDICYRKGSDVVNYKTQIESRFLLNALESAEFENEGEDEDEQSE